METDIYGDNHSFATAYDLGIDAAIQSADGASIAIAEEKDYYSFKLTERATITLTTSGPDDFADTVLYLCDSDEELIGYNDDAGMDGYSRIAQPLDPGTYYVIVNAYGTQTIDEYSLTVSFSNDTIAPVVSNVQADITEPTDQKVTVTAEFSDNVGVASKKYMIGENGYWLDYPSGGVVVTKNKTVYFMAVDEAGNTSAIVPYEVTNIVSGPDIYGDNHSFDTAYDLGTDDAIKSAYGASIDTAGEEDYYTFTLTERATVKLATNGSDYDDTVMYLYDSDQELIAENDENGISSYSLVSKALDPGTYYVVVTAYDNDLIDDYYLTVSLSDDTTAPVVSNVQADITEPTDESVTVTAEFSDDVGVVSARYRINGGAWFEYPDDGVVVTENGTVYFMAVDEAGNESEIVSYEVTNIIPAGLVDAYGDNHSFDTAYDLGSDTAIKSADDASVTIAGEVDYFSFTLTQDADVTLRTTGGADSFDTFLYLYDGDQNEIAYNDDNIRIRQILINLLGNAVKFTKKGAITLHVTFTPKPGSANIGTLKCAVSDTGIGISEEDQKKLMEPFVQLSRMRDTNAVKNGTGLGLSISKRLATCMNGELTCTSKPGEGSTFTITLNAVRYRAKAVRTDTTQAQAEIEAIARDVKAIRILIVDDLPMNLRVAQAIFNKVGFDNVFTAESGREALELLNRQPVDLILSDMWMPEMDGAQFAAEVKNNPGFAHIPIVAQTADVESNGNFDMSHFDAIILKPLTKEKLSNMVKRIIVKGDLQKGSGGTPVNLG